MKKIYLLLPLLSLICLTGCSRNTKPQTTYSFSTPSYDVGDPTKNISFEYKSDVKDKLDEYKTKIINHTLTKDELLEIVNEFSANDLYFNKSVRYLESFDHYDYDKDPTTLSGDNFELKRVYTITRDNNLKLAVGLAYLKYITPTENIELNGSYSLTYDLDTISYTKQFNYSYPEYDEKTTYVLSEYSYSNELNQTRAEDFLSRLEETRNYVNKQDFLNETFFGIEYDQDNDEYVFGYSAEGTISGCLHQYEIGISITSNGCVNNQLYSYKEIIDSQVVSLSSEKIISSLI